MLQTTISSWFNFIFSSFLLTQDFKYAWVYHTIECQFFSVLQTYTTRHVKVDKDTVKCGVFHDVD